MMSVVRKLILLATFAAVAAGGPSEQQSAESQSTRRMRNQRNHDGDRKIRAKDDIRFSADDEIEEKSQDSKAAPALPRLRICNAHPGGEMTVSMAPSSAHTGRYSGPSKEHRERAASRDSLLSIDPEEESNVVDEDLDESDESDVSMQASPSSIASSYATKGKNNDWRYRAGDTPGFEDRMKLLGKIPMQACKEFVTAIGTGDYLRFEIAGTHHRRAGIYMPDDPDGSEGRVFIMAYTKDAVNNKIDIKVHFFERMHMPRVAVVNVAPPGPDSSVPGGEIRVVRRDGDKHVDNIVMRYDTVTSIDAGWHVVKLFDKKGNLESSAELQAVHGEGYIVARVEPGKVLIFPHPAPYATYDEWLAAKAGKKDDRQKSKVEKDESRVRSGARFSGNAPFLLVAVILFFLQ